MKDFLESYFLCIRGSFHNRRQLLRIKWKDMIFALKFVILTRATRKQYINLSISTTPYWITLYMLIFAGINRWFYYHILLKYCENETFEDSKRTIIRRQSKKDRHYIIMAKSKDKKTNNTHPEAQGVPAPDTRRVTTLISQWSDTSTFRVLS